MNNDRRKTLVDIAARLGTLDLQSFVDEVADVQGEEQDAFDNMPEGLQQSERGLQMEEGLASLDEAVCALDEALAQVEIALAAIEAAQQ